MSRTENGTTPRLAAAALLGCAWMAGCAHGKDTNPYSDWVTVRSENFVVHTDVSRGTAQQVVHELEALHSALKAAFFPNTELRNIEVLLFSTPEAARREAHNVQGPFVGANVRPIVLTSRSGDEARRELTDFSSLYQQQAATALTGRMLLVNMRRAPMWFRIGLESYAETVQIQGNVARFGLRLSWETRELAAGRVIPLAKLIAAPPSEFRIGSNWYRSYRASAWAFFHFLFSADQGALRARFPAIVRSLAATDQAGAAASRTAIEKAFPETDFAALEGRARDYAVTELGPKTIFSTLMVEFRGPPERDYPTAMADPDHLRGLLKGGWDVPR